MSDEGAKGAMGGEDEDEDEVWTPLVPALIWSEARPLCAGYYWVRTAGYERGVVVGVKVGGDGDLVADWPLRRRLDDVDGWWAGPIPEPVAPPEGETDRERS